MRDVKLASTAAKRVKRRDVCLFSIYIYIFIIYIYIYIYLTGMIGRRLMGVIAD